jgi:hypothetical protein
MLREEKQSRLTDALMIFFVLAGINMLGNFSLASQFSMYEDDYLLTVPPLLASGHELFERIKYAFLHWPLGRPFYFILQDCLSWLAGKSGGISQLYTIGLLLSTTGAFSVYALLSRFLAQRFALLAAAAFILFPPDTAKQIFMHHISFSFGTILAVCCISDYLDRKYIRAILCSIVMLLTYEAYFLILPAAALLRHATSARQRCLEIMKWGLALAGVLFAILTIRHLMGEGRAGSLLDKPSDLLARSAQAMGIGPYVMLKLIFSRVAEGIVHGNGLQWIFALCSGAPLVMALKLLPAQAPRMPLSQTWLMLAAGAAIVIPYAYRFSPDYYPPHISIGRLSALHQVTALGFALLWGTTLSAFDRTFARPRAGLILGCCTVVLFVPFSLEIQETQYVRHARQQTIFWNELLSQIPDLEDNMEIIVDLESGFGPGYDNRPGTEGFSVWWLMNYPVKMLPRLVNLPAHWKNPPRIFAYWRAAPQWAVGETLAVKTSYIITEKNPVILKNGNFLLFKWEDGHLQRSISAIESSGISVTPKAPSMNKHKISFPLTTFGKNFITQEKTLWPTLVRSIVYPEQ